MKTIILATLIVASLAAHANVVPHDVSDMASKTPAFAYANAYGRLFLLTNKACPLPGSNSKLGIVYYAYRGRAYPYLMCWKENGDHIVETRIDFDSAGAAYAVGMPPLSISEGAFMKGDPRPTSAFE
jgi:hypothetical protein